MLRIAIPWVARWATNQLLRHGPQHRGRIIADIRRESKKVAAGLALTGRWPVHIVGSVIGPPGYKPGLDVDGISLALKAAIDGIVDAGVLPDDGPDHLAAVTMSVSSDTAEVATLRLTVVEP